MCEQLTDEKMDIKPSHTQPTALRTRLSLNSCFVFGGVFEGDERLHNNTRFLFRAYSNYYTGRSTTKNLDLRPSSLSSRSHPVSVTVRAAVIRSILFPALFHLRKRHKILSYVRCNSPSYRVIICSSIFLRFALYMAATLNTYISLDPRDKSLRMARFVLGRRPPHR
ncbi:hypothetical protein Zmor_008469 [Zophobas morio]|uniref:Transmembrane protein n=1 Tax=Zophobas morio TaxID=2755281 RepID=A0AA38J2V3_9CUCU|nr:hypothetical protein Zmor_008469 [Zophobas morio]